MNVVGGGDPLGEPLGLATGWARAEEFRVVVEPADQLGINPAQAALGQLDQPLDVRLERGVAPLKHRCAAWHGPEAANRIQHLGTVDHVVDQIGNRTELTATAADRRQQLEVIGRPQQLAKSRHPAKSNSLQHDGTQRD